MKKIFILLLMALAIGALAFLLFRAFSDDGDSFIPETVKAGDASGSGQVGQSAQAGRPGSASSSGGPKIMNMEGLELSQGENGKVLWTLHADQAEMKEEGGVIYATDPFLTYYMRPEQPEGAEAQTAVQEPDVLTVKSLNGDVDQQTHDMRFVNDVLVINDDKRMTSEELTYSGADRTLTSPDKTFFDSPNMNGDSGKVVWDLNTNMLYGSGGVTVNWETVQSEK